MSRNAEDIVFLKWESELATLYDSGVDLSEIKQKTRDTLKDQSEDRLSVWLMNRFIYRLQTVDYGEFIQSVKKSKIDSIFKTDTAGKVVNDASGTPIWKNEGTERFNEEFGVWKVSARKMLDSAIETWDHDASAEYTELLNGLSGERRTWMENQGKVLLSSYHDSQVRELDALLLLEESNYAYLRLRDQYSLRLQTEGTSAETVAETLIAKTQESINEGINHLVSGLDVDVGDVSVDGNLVDGDEWQSMFLEELEKGLARWDAASEEFLVRRVEWEKKAGADLAIGMESWNDAFRLLQEKQSAWLNDCQVLRERGQQRFQQNFQQLKNAQKQAMDELNMNIAANEGSLSERVEATVGMLAQSLDMMNTAKNSLGYWLGKMKNSSNYDIDQVSWDVDALRKEILLSVYPSLSNVGWGWNSSRQTQDFSVSCISVPGSAIDDFFMKCFDFQANASTFESYISLTPGVAKRLDESAALSNEDYQRIFLDFWMKDETAIANNVSDFLDKQVTIHKNKLTDEISRYKESLKKANRQSNWLSVTGTWDIGTPTSFDSTIVQKIQFIVQETEKGNLSTEYRDALINEVKGIMRQAASELQVKITANQEALDSYTSQSLAAIPEAKIQCEKIFKDMLREYVAQRMQPAVDGNDTFSQMFYWMENVYRGYAIDAKEQNAEIAETYGLLVFGTQGNEDQSLTDSDLIRDPIAALNTLGWDEIYLDSYQVELLKERAVRDYWEKELEIAQAVHDYSTDHGQDRETAASTLEKYKQTLAAYTSALDDYTSALGVMKEADGALSEKKNEIAAVQKTLADKQKALKDAKEEYSTLLVMKQLQSSAYFTEQYRSSYSRLLELRGQISAEDPANSLPNATDNVANASAAYDSAVLLKNSSEALDKLLNGDPAATTPMIGVMELKVRLEKLEQFTVDKDAIDTPVKFQTWIMDSLVLGEGDAWFEILNDYYLNEYRMNSKNIGGLTLILQTAQASIMNEVSGKLERGLMDMRMLLAGTSDSALCAIEGLTGTKNTATTIAGTTTALENAAGAAKTALLKERISVELSALGEILSDVQAYTGSIADYSFSEPKNFNDAASTLAWLFVRNYRAQGNPLGDLEKNVMALTESLTKLDTSLAGITDSVKNHADTLRSLASSDSTIQAYLNGDTIFRDSYADYTVSFLTTFAAYSALAGNGNDVADEFSRYAGLSVGLRQAMRDEAYMTFDKWLQDNSLGSISNGILTLKSPVEICNEWNTSNIRNIGDAIDAVVKLENGANDVLYSAGMPASVKQAFSDWLSEVSSLVLVNGMRITGTGEVGADALAEYRRQADEASKRYSDRAALVEDTREAAQNNPAYAAIGMLKIADTIESSAAADFVPSAVSCLGSDFASWRLGLESDVDDATEWQAQFSSWLSKVAVSDLDTAICEKYRNDIIRAAASMWEKAHVSANTSNFDYSTSANKDELDVFALDNALRSVPLESYLSSLKTSNIRDDSLALYYLSEYFSGLSGNALKLDFDDAGIDAAWLAISFDGDADKKKAFEESDGVGDQNAKSTVLEMLCALRDLDVPGKATFGSIKALLPGYSTDTLTGEPYATLLKYGTDGSLGSNLYASLYSSYLYSSLSDLSVAERDGACAVAFGATGIGLNESLDLKAFANGDDTERIMQTLMLDDRALSVALKTRILSGATVDAYITDSVRDEINRFRSVISASDGYIQTFDGPLLGYLVANSGSRPLTDSIAALNLRTAGFFDDPLYMNTAFDAGSVKDRLDGYVTTSGFATSSIFGYLETGLWDGVEALGEVYRDASMRLDTAMEYNALVKAANGKYRMHLADDTIVLNTDKRGTWETAREDGIKYDKSGTTASLAADSGASMLCGNSDALNGVLEQIAFTAQQGDMLNAVFASWSKSDSAVAAQAYLEGIADLTSITKASKMDDDAEILGKVTIGQSDYESIYVYEQAVSAHRDLLSEQYGLVSALNTYGASVIAFKNNSEAGTIGADSELVRQIQALERDIGMIEVQWDELIRGNGSTLGYSQLEQRYRELYTEAQEKFTLLQAAKQTEKTAKAVYEYASTPYLGVDEAKKRDTSLTDESLAELQETLDSIDAVDPDKRLLEVGDRHKRAAAAVAALEAIYADPDGKQSVYETDETYATLRNQYESMYRYRLAAKQTQELMNEKTRKAKEDLEKARNNYLTEVLSSHTFRSIEKEEQITERIKNNGLSDGQKKLINSLSIVDGQVSFSGTSGSMDYESFLAYINPGTGDFSEFDAALIDWFSRVNASRIEQWTYALSWDEYVAAGGTTQLSYVGFGWRNRSGDEKDEAQKRAQMQEYYSNCRIARSTLLADFKGNDGNEYIDHAIGQRSLVYDLRGCQDNYRNVGDTKDYQFFKMLCLLNGLSGECAKILNTGYAGRYYAGAADGCQDEADDVWARRKKEIAWTSRDEARNLSAYAYGLLANQKDRIISTGSSILSARQNVEKQQLNLDSLSGNSGSGVTLDSIATAILYASSTDKSNPLQDILKTSGISGGTDKDRLVRLLSLDGTLVYSSGDDISKALRKFVDSSEAGTKNASNELNVYINSTDAQNQGIAVRQANNESRYRQAYVSFIAGGMLPDEYVSESDVEAWETLVAESLAKPGSGENRIVTAAEKYMLSIDGKNIDGLAVRNLREALFTYRNSDSAMKKNAWPLVEKAFGALVSAYRTGVDYRKALTVAHENTLFNAREDSLRTCDFYLKLYGDLNGEHTSLRNAAIQETVATFTTCLSDINAKRNAEILDVKKSEWDVLTEELAQEQALFYQQINAIYSRGNLEWRNAERKLSAGMETWQKEYQRSFQAKTAAWEMQYVALLEGKEAWVTDLTEQAVNIGNAHILGTIATKTEDYIAKASDFIISDVIELPDTKTMMADMLDEELLSGLISGATTLTQGIGKITPTLFQTLKRDGFMDGETLGKIREFQTSQNDELQTRIAYIQYDQALTALEEAHGQVEESIEDANESTDEGFRELLVLDGFNENGDNFVKDTIVGATFWDNLYETHVIGGYRDFETNVKDFTEGFVDPKSVDIEKLGSVGMQALLAQAMEAVPEEYARIFGEQNEDGTWKNATYQKQFMKTEEFDRKTSQYDSNAGRSIDKILKLTRQVKSSETVSAGDYAAYLKQLEELGGNDSERMYVTGNGIFNEHVGIAPVMKNDADPTVALENYWKNVRFDGTGETGRIMGLYIQHRMIEGAGYAEANQPGYNLRLWDDRGSWMKAPTIRTVTDIGVTAIAAVVAGPMGAAAISLIDDAVFTVLDVSNGMDATDAFGSLGKKALSSMVSSRISFAFSAGGGLLSSTMLGDNLIGKTLTKGIELSAINMTSSAINSVDVRGLVSGNDMFNEQSFIEGTFGKTAMTNVMSGMANSYVSNALGKSLSEIDLEGFGRSQLSNVNSIASTFGGVASTAVTYGMTGNASVNLLNMNMFGGPSVGLFELGFGKNGLSGAVSMGGTDMNLGRLLSTAKGFNVLSQNKKIEAYSEKEGIDSNVALRALYSYADKSGRDLYKDFLSGDAKLSVDASLDGKAKTTTGVDGVRNVTVRSLGGGTGITDSVVLQHEAHRDGLASADQGAETLEAARSHTEMAIAILKDGIYGNSILENQTLVNDIGNYLQGEAAFNSYVGENYDSSGDYWRVVKQKNGTTTLENDGSDDVTYVDENGNVTGTKKYTGGSKTDFLGSALGISKDTANTILSNAGYDYVDGKFVGGGKITLMTSVGSSNTVLPSWFPNLYAGLVQPKILKIDAANSVEKVNKNQTLQTFTLSSDGKIPDEAWVQLTDPNNYRDYAAVTKDPNQDKSKPIELNQLSTQCNTFVDKTLKTFGDEVYKAIMPYGSQDPNKLFYTWSNNANLIQLGNSDDAWNKAVELADQGYIVLSAASNGGRHVAFVLPRTIGGNPVAYDPIPATDWKMRPGYGPLTGQANYSGEFKRDWPAFYQAGSYTGIVSPRWAYTPDMIKYKQIHFYVYKGSGK